MEVFDAMQMSYEIARIGRIKNPSTGLVDFKAYSESIVDIIADMGPIQRKNDPRLGPFLRTWRRMVDEYDKLCEADPMIRYRPKHKVAEEFHRSKAWARYYSGGNRTSKTTSGYAEHYMLHTGSNIYRDFEPPVHNSFIVAGDGQPFKSYAPNVFETKLVKGEPGDYLTPMFPEGGKWFNHYDQKAHVLKVCCPACAKDGRPGTWCPKSHTKGAIMLFSAEQGSDVIEAFSATLGHGDEHVPEEFFQAMKIRIGGRNEGGGCLIFTNTPRQGLHAWEEKDLKARALGNPALNLKDPNDPTSDPYASFHTITMRDAGIVSESQISAMEQGMDSYEARARILGLAAPTAKNPVFDRDVLAKMSENEVVARVGQLSVCGNSIVTCAQSHEIMFEECSGPMRVWEEPIPGETYIMGVDAANGLTGKDAACCSVIKITIENQRLHMKLVAQWHGWVDPISYAYEIKKVGVWYNYACAVIELNGVGRAVMFKLKNELFYWNLFTDPAAPEKIGDHEIARCGVDTNSATKPMMVGMLQEIIRTRRLTCLCPDTIRELSAYEQERTESGLTTRYRGAGDHDDRVMSLVVIAFAVTVYPMVSYMSGGREQAAKAAKATAAVTAKISEDDAYYRAKFKREAQRKKDPFL